MNARKTHLYTLAISLLLGCCLLWGFQQVLIKATLAEVPPMFQASLRLVGATALLWLWCLRRGVPLFRRDGSLRAGLLAGGLFAAEFACIYLGLQMTSASRLTVFLYTSPFWVALLVPLWVKSERLRGIARAEAFAQREQHRRKRAHQPQPLQAAQAFRLHPQRHQQRNPKRRGVQKHRQPRRAGHLQAQVNAGKFARKQPARQQAGPQRAVTLEQANAACQAPQPEQRGGTDQPQRGLEHRRNFRNRRFDQHLLEAPEQAAGQQQRDGEGVQVGFTRRHWHDVSRAIRLPRAQASPENRRARAGASKLVFGLQAQGVARRVAVGAYQPGRVVVNGVAAVQPDLAEHGRPQLVLLLVGG